jgi:glycine cleavage system protein P-like pyridoxal-binding family
MFVRFLVMAGMKIEKIQLDKAGAVDMKHVADLAQKFKDTLACGIVTYPSTSGVFEESIRLVRRSNCFVDHDASLLKGIL